MASPNDAGTLTPLHTHLFFTPDILDIEAQTE